MQPANMQRCVALKSDKACVEAMRKTYEKRAELLEKGLNCIKGFSFMKPEGAFYAFVNIKKPE